MFLPRSPRRRLRRKQHQRPRQRRKLVQYYHHLNRSNMQRVTGRHVGSQGLKVQVQRIRRRSHVISTFSTSHVRKGKIVNTVMIRKSSTRTKLEMVAKVAEKHREANHLPTGRRRSMNHVGIGQKGNVDMGISATRGMTHICSRRHSMLMLHLPLPLRLLHYIMVTTVTMNLLSLRPPRLRQRRR